MSHETIYADGGVRLVLHTPPISAFWLDGFPPAGPGEQDRGRGPAGRVSPIYDYDDGGIGGVQWVNVTHNVAAILKSDGGWKTGGRFHLWISPGAAREPYDYPGFRSIRIEAGDPEGWHDRQKEAIAEAEAFLGLRRIAATE